MTLAIPRFDDYGYLQAGVHSCTFRELESLLGWNESRRHLLRQLQQFIDEQLVPEFKLPPTSDPRQSLAGVMSVMRNISVPWGTPDPEHPNISPTWWRTLIDQKNRLYYFDSALSPQMVWVNLNQVDFKPGSGVRAIKIEGNEALQGNVSRQLQPAAAIQFLAPR